MAWLHATPKPPEGSRRAKGGGRVSTLSRMDRMKRDGITPQMPPSSAPHIIRYLIEIGLTEAAGMGAAALSWREINEWQRASCIRLQPWEARIMRRLSNEYLSEGRRAESEACPPPWRAKVTRREIDIDEAKLDLLLG